MGKYGIGTISQRTGFSPARIRQWERRFGVPSPARGDNRYRQYTDEDIEKLLWLRRQLAAGISISRAIALLQDEFANPSAARSKPQSLAVVEAFVDAVTRLDERTARQVFSEATACFPVEAVCETVITPALVEIGARWERAELSIGAEHLATNLAREWLIRMLAAQPASTAWAPRALCACAPGELHEIGALMVALALARSHWAVHYLGQMTSGSDLLAFARKTSCDLLCVSASRVESALAVYDLALRAREAPRVNVAIGGRIFATYPALRSCVPAWYLSDTATTSVEAARQALGQEPPSSTSLPDDTSIRALQGQRYRLVAELAAHLSKSGDGFAQLPDPGSPLLASATIHHASVASLLCNDLSILQGEVEWMTRVLGPAGVSPAALTNALTEYARLAERTVAEAQVSLHRLIQPVLSR